MLQALNVAGGTNSLPSAFKASQSYNYDNWGNITYKTGAGYYKYDSNRVHQLLGVYSNSNFTGTKYYFGYDASGNVTNDGSRLFTYSSIDKPTRITKGSAISNMKYGVDKELYYKDDSFVENGKNVRYRRYYIGAYEKLVRNGGNGNLTEHKYNIGNAVITYRNGSRTTSFTHKDNQGSVISTTNHLGQVTTQAIYDPFGKQSEVFKHSTYVTSLPAITDRGYTGHKQMNHLDIIHMGGRIYDPTIGRFLQADPFIQAPSNSQSYNRYSYVLNNPMSMTDPSGFNFIDSFFKGINKAFGKFSPFVGLAFAIWNPFFAYGMRGAAGTGFISGGVATGSLKGALVGGFSGAAFYGIGQQFKSLSNANIDKWNAASSTESGSLMDSFHTFGGLELTSGQIAGQTAIHAATGGVVSVLADGKFGHGFFSAGVTKGIGGEYLPAGSNLDKGEISKGTVISAVIGGTASVISGGKFANGARTASFQYLFNQAGSAFRDMLARERTEWERRVDSINRKLDTFAQHNRWAGEAIVESVRDNLKFKGGVEAAFGAGFTAQLSTNLNMDMGYETAYIKGVMFNPVGSVGGNIYSSGNISGFYQSLDICAVGCVNIEWNYQNWSFGTSIGPAAGVSFSMGTKGEF